LAAFCHSLRRASRLVLGLVLALGACPAEAQTDFVEDTSAAGLSVPVGNAQGAAWGDYDGDGDPDLYIPSISGPNLLYQNTGDG
jgi:hypothetical protein